MTSTATEEVTPVVESTPEAPDFSTVRDSLDDFSKMVLNGPHGNDGLLADADEYNSKVTLLKSIGGDEQEMLEALRDTSETPEVVRLRGLITELDDKREALWNKRDEILKAEVKTVQANSGGDVEAVTAEVDTLYSKIKTGLAYLAQLSGGKTGEDIGINLLRRNNRGTSSGTPRSGSSRRVRGFDVFVAKNAEAAVHALIGSPPTSNLAAAAKLAGVDTEVIQKAFFAVAGTDAKSYPEVVEFDIVNGDNTFHVRCRKIASGAE